MPHNYSLLGDSRGPAEVKTGFSRRSLLVSGGVAAAGVASPIVSFGKPAGYIPDAPKRPGVESWTDRGIHAAWLGHSTVLLRIDGFTILTDPIFSFKAGIHLGLLSLGVTWLIKPAMERRELPHIDLVLLSHAHMDHFDIPSLRSLEDRQTRVITARGTADLLRARKYLSVTELGWGETHQSGPASVRAIQVRHWGRRYMNDSWRGYTGYVVNVGRYRVLFAGDTAFTDTFKRDRPRDGVHLALLPIGAYNPWIHNHADPEQAWRMGQYAGADYILPIHHQTFPLSLEPRLEPIERILTAAGNRETSVPIREIGGEMYLS